MQAPSYPIPLSNHEGTTLPEGLFTESGNPEFLEIEFVNFISKLSKRLNQGEVVRDAQISSHLRADLIIENESIVHIIECKRITPQTQHRVRNAAEQLSRYEESVRHQLDPQRTIETTLAVPGKLSKRLMYELAEHDITVWDAEWIAEKSALYGLAQEAVRFIGDETIDEGHRLLGPRLSERLKGMPPGQKYWPAYQNLCQDILEYLFSPPLSPPIRERGNHTKTKRRDIILPNYSEEGFWRFARHEYRADHLLVDAKNYSKAIKKEQVLQIANYLQRHGVGLFALIMCRSGHAKPTLFTLREQWILHDKMIIVIDDNDVLQMIIAKSSGNDPTELIRQKIEDFRLDI